MANSRKFPTWLVVALCLTMANAYAQAIGGSVLPADPYTFRSELDAGFIYPEFALFKFGDVRETFPLFGGTAIRDVFDKRGYAPSYYLGARETFKLGSIWKTPIEFSLRGGFYDAHRKSSFTENEVAPEMYFPYIDGAIRPDLTGGAVVGMFANTRAKLGRRLFSYEVEGGLRAIFRASCWAFMPGVYFTYQRMKQKDSVSTSGSGDPTEMLLRASILSDHYNVGGSFRFSGPLCTLISWIGSAEAGAEKVSASYKGSQSFAGPNFNDPLEQSARASDRKDRWGLSVGAETGLCFFPEWKVSLSVLGNFRYIKLLPYVIYPVPIIDTNEVTGPAHLSFQHQFTFGGEVNLSAKF